MTNSCVTKLWQIRIQKWKSQGQKKELKSCMFKSAEELTRIIEAKDNWQTNSVLFFAPETITYGEVQKWYTLIRKQFPIAYVFQPKKEESAKPAEKTAAPEEKKPEDTTAAPAENKPEPATP